MELGERVLEGHTHWNPGISQVSVPQQQQQQQAPQQPPAWPSMQSGSECLMNVNTTGAGTDMFGGYPLILSGSDGGTHRISEFSRHRFPTHSSSMHFSNIPSSPSGIGGHSSHHHEGLTLINIPTLGHATLGGVDDAEGNASGQVQVQDGQNSLGLEMEGGGHHGLDDCSEECSEDEEEDDEIEESEDEEMGYIHHNHGMSHPSMNVDQEHPLPSCQHPRQLRVINSNGEDVNMMNNISMENHQKNSILSQIHDIEEEIPPINQGHPLNSNPISAIPMITGNCNMMMGDQQEVIGNTSQQSGEPLLGINGGGGDPSSCSGSGHSVHGKMYVEERVVFHLKQWTESGFGNFNSCREQEMNQPKNQYGCAVCHIRSPHDNTSNKDTHRHLVRGILFSFEDCIILELYPEEYTDGGQEPRSHHSLSMSMDPKHGIHMESTANKPNEETVPLSYFNASSTSAMPDIVLPEHEPHSSLEKPSTIGHNNQQGDGGWWEYDSTEREVEIERQHSINHHVSPESCAINLKLTAQHFHDAQAAVASRETNEIEDINNEGQQIDNINNIHESVHDKEFRNYQESQPKYDHSLSSHQYYTTSDGMNDNGIQTISSKCIVEGEENNGNELPSPISDVDVSQPPVQNQVTTFPEESVENETCLEIELPSLPPDSDPDHVDDGSAPQDGNTTRKKLKKPKTGSNKYPCPDCEKCFKVQRHLKEHVKTKHMDNFGKRQSKDGKRLRKLSYLKTEGTNDKSHESISNQSSNSNSINSNTESKDTVLSQPAPDGDSEILELVLASKSSKVRKFSEKASRILAAESASMSSSEIESPSGIDEQENSKQSLVMNFGEGKNRVEEKEGRGETSLRSCSNKLTTVPPIKINHDQNNLHFAPATDVIEVKLIKSKDFRCEVCGRHFSQLRRLINHAACHKPEKSSQCEQCGKSFARRDKLLRHMFVHSEEKMFSCHVCEKRFSRRDKLSDHLKSHQTDEIHNCNVCQRQFLRPDILKQHLKMHLMSDKHQCSECLRFVTGKSRLDQHMKRHEEAKASGLTLLCPLCTKYFIQAQSLKAHIRKFHPDALDQLNLNQLQFGSSSSDEKECGGQNNLMDDNNPRCTDSPPSSSNSNASSFSMEPGTAEDELKSGEEVKRKGKVVQSVQQMSSSESKTKPKKVLKKSFVPVTKTSTEVKLTTFSCTHCSKTFSRNQTLKNHEARKHPNEPSCNPISESTPASRTTNPGDELRKDPSEQGKVKSRGHETSLEAEVLHHKKLIPKKKLKPIKTETNSTANQKKKIAKSLKPLTESPSPLITTPRLQQTLSLPSCATLTQDLAFNTGNNATFQQSQTHLHPYSHQLSLSSLVVGDGGLQNISQLQNTLPMGSLVVTELPHQGQGGQKLSSIQLVNAQGQHVQLGESICPQTSSFVISYPTSSTAPMPFQP